MTSLTLDQMPLGRNVWHDPDSLLFGAVDPAAAQEPVTVLWRPYGRAINQRRTNSCTGHGLVHCLNCRPLHKLGQKLLTHQDALNLYARATEIDPFPGVFHNPSVPGDVDAGSSGLAVCKAAKEAGLITRYEWAFGIDQTLLALQRGALIAGLPWLADMGHPDAEGIIRATGAYRGGHEICITGVDMKRGLVRIRNSWGPEWGLNGSAWIPIEDLGMLLDRQGDVILPIFDRSQTGLAA